jgi:hypothetical protein
MVTGWLFVLVFAVIVTVIVASVHGTFTLIDRHRARTRALLATHHDRAA